MAHGDFADAGWRAKNIAYMPQFQSVAWPLSVREVVALGLLPLHLGAAESEKRVDSALQRCGMARFATRRIDTLSGGEKARLVLALITYQKPNLLLLDEPTNHLDLEMRHALNVALQGFEGAMVLISHDRFLLSLVCDDFYLVNAGSV